MPVEPWVWGVTILATAGLIVFDFYAHVRTPHEPTLPRVGDLVGRLHRPGHRVRDRPDGRLGR